MYSRVKVVAMDLDGTLTNHKTPLSNENREVLTKLSKKYKLLMVGAGQVERIFNQLNKFPLDIIGNYGMQYGVYDNNISNIKVIRNDVAIGDREWVEKRVKQLREQFGYTNYKGNSVEFHPSGVVTFAILGTKANQQDKLAFDPDRQKRRKIYKTVCEIFYEYNVFVGGSSSFDMAPKPFDKRFALEKYCKENGIDIKDVAYIGDDYGEGGNDEPVYKSDAIYIKIDDYEKFGEVVKPLLNNI